MSDNIWPEPGMVVYVRFLLVFRHKGIVSNRFRNGKPMVIANSWTSQGVDEVAWDVFSGGHPVFPEQAHRNDLHPLEVLYNARSMIGQSYDVMLSNCEHFVCKAYGLPPRSPQLAVVVLLAAAATITFLAAKS